MKHFMTGSVFTWSLQRSYDICTSKVVNIPVFLGININIYFEVSINIVFVVTDNSDTNSTLIFCIEYLSTKEITI